MVIRNVSYIAFNEKTQEIIYLKTMGFKCERQAIPQQELFRKWREGKVSF